MKRSTLHLFAVSSIVAAVGVACSSDDLGAAGDTGGTGAAASGGSMWGTGAPPSGGSGVGTGAASSGGAGATPSSCDVTPIMQVSCAGIICHGYPGQPAQYNTDLFNPPAGQTVGQMLLGKPANYALVANPVACPTANPELIINPTAPSESLILKKIMGTQACGVKMPNSQDIALSQEQVACFVSWVNGVTGNSGTGGAGSGGVGTGGAGSGGAGTGGLATGGAGTGGAASSGGTSGGTGIQPTFDTVKVILTQNVTTCVASDCHGGHEGRLDLQVNDGLLARLTSSTSEICGMPIVSPGSPTNSALVKVLRDGCGNVSPNCLVGTECIPRMPLNCAEGVDCIPEDYIIAVEQWIANGAQP